MSEPERLTPKGELLADHERRKIDTTGLARRGGEKASVIVLGCIDMRDVYSKKAQKSMAEVLAAFPNDVALYIRPYWNVLESGEAAEKNGHKPAIEQRELTQLLAAALVAAEQQGKIWELHDLIFAAEKEQLTREGLAKLATDAGLDVEKWTAALDAEATKTAVAAHKQACNALGVDRATPIYFINGRMVRGALPTEAMTYLVELELFGGFEALPKP
jgi:predicted DsbA family dithiol-disulfide isomerase